MAAYKYGYVNGATNEGQTLLLVKYFEVWFVYIVSETCNSTGKVVT